MTHSQIKKLITLIGFKPEDDTESIFHKDYVQHRGYRITLDFSRERIKYGNRITKGDETTSHFNASENFVVLECIDRLLAKGYSPDDLTLERKWKLGRELKSGKADINVQGRNGKTLIIIECKTFGTEFEKEEEKMKEDGGQLISYFQQDKSTKYLCLYASHVNDNTIEYENAIISVEDNEEEKINQQIQSDLLLTYEIATNVPQLLEVWQNKNKKNFLRKGIFEEGIEPYNPGFEPIRIRDLKEFRKDDSGKLFNEFEEILRHNNISDRSNAFNRFISLVLAKIVDETKAENDITDFQVKTGVDTAEDLMDRMQTLYSRAMQYYLKEDVVNYTLNDIEKELNNFPRQTAKETLRKIYRELKYYSNNEFAFKEVYNEKLFIDNARVLFELVRLFERYRFRLNRKDQFLGEFFEQMLENGYKQSEGQFFTPTPIARFIISSIPFKEIIEEKLRSENPNFLPTLIDYACGSGHFLTEAIEEVRSLLNELPNERHERLPDLKKSTDWAGDYICGIEKDYRLSRTSQVACFMHGDGKARIIFGDGLERHEDRMPVKKYDVLVANPPYTIKDFKKHLNLKQIAKFELLNEISIDSDDIEVLFVERAGQLLKDGGYTGLILPVSILNNTGIYTKAREIILRQFEIRSIVEFGSQTFGATGTSTVVLFLKRRNDDFAINCAYIAEDFIEGKDVHRANDFVNSGEIFQSYCNYIKIPVDDFRSLLERNPSESIKELEWYQNYQYWFNSRTDVKNLKKNKTFLKLSPENQEKRLLREFFDAILNIEKDKFEFYLLTHRIIEQQNHDTELIEKVFIPQQTLVVKSGRENDVQKAFLGYSFSDRRGYKGLYEQKDIYGKPITKLYDQGDIHNPDKVNAHVYQQFIDGDEIPIPSTLRDHINKINLVDCISFSKVDFGKQINLSVESRKVLFTINSVWPLESFVKVATLEYGNSLPDSKRVNGEYPVVGSNGVVGKHNAFLIEGPSIIVGRKGSAGKINWIEENSFPIDTTYYIKHDPSKILLPYLYLIMQQLPLEEMGSGSGVPGLNRNDVYDLKIPIPPKSIQQQIIEEVAVVEREEQETFNLLQNLRIDINNILSSFKEFKSIQTICSRQTDKVEPQAYGEDELNYIGLEHIESNTGALVSDWKPTTASALKSSKAIFQEGDILYGKLRPYLNKVWIADRQGVCSTDILVLKTDYPIILKHILLSDEFVSRSTSLMKGTNLPRLQVKEFLAFKINLPKQSDLTNVTEQLSLIDVQMDQTKALLSGAVDRKVAILHKHLNIKQEED